MPMSIVSISGRKIASAPVPGDVELLQLCAAFASSSFFAWCHLNQGDVKVDFFTEHLAERWVHVLDALGSLLVAASVRCWPGAPARAPPPCMPPARPR
jgi:hypothetical protein